MRRRGLSGELVAECFGTFILILLGDGVVANVGLAPRLAPGAYGWTAIALGWAFAVVIAVYVAGGVTGAHINPAVTLAMAARRDFPWRKVPAYAAAQTVGAFLGAAAVFLVYREGLQAAGMPNVWSTGPGSVFGQAFWGSGGSLVAGPAGSYSLLTASTAELFGTMVLLWGVLAVFDDRNWGVQSKTNLGALLVGFTVLGIGLSLGGPSGYAINPARDLGPRIFGALAGTSGLFEGVYWIVAPVLVPAVAGILGVVLYDLFIGRNLPGEPAE